MLTLNFSYDILPNRQVIIQLPLSVQPGHHEIVIVLDKASDIEDVAVTDISRLMQFSGTVSAFTSTDGVEYQTKARSEWS